MVKINFDYLEYNEDQLKEEFQERIDNINKGILEKIEQEKNGENHYLGWVNLPEKYDREEFDRIKEATAKIRRQSDVLIVVGIGGSYLGARAIMEALKNEKDNMVLLYLGNSLSTNYMKDVLDYIEDKDFSINVISKSGTTLEPAVTFRILEKILVDRYGEEAYDRIYITTDAKKGALKEYADVHGIETFLIPDNIGGRYSVLTAVGLLPISVSGVDIDILMKGAYMAYEKLKNVDVKYNEAIKYAILRYKMYMEEKKKVELLVSYEPKMAYFNEWFKQLFGESEGKEGKGLFPASVTYTTDLHSLGQYVQEGNKILFETVMNFSDDGKNIIIEENANNLDGLNYLTGKSLYEINKQAMIGTCIAHRNGGVPNILLDLGKFDERTLGYLLYFFEYACMYSAYLLEVNPFNQPGVEAYKKNMFELLGRDI